MQFLAFVVHNLEKFASVLERHVPKDLDLICTEHHTSTQNSLYRITTRTASFNITMRSVIVYTRTSIVHTFTTQLKDYTIRSVSNVIIFHCQRKTYNGTCLTKVKTDNEVSINVWYGMWVGMRVHVAYVGMVVWWYGDMQVSVHICAKIMKGGSKKKIKSTKDC